MSNRYLRFEEKLKKKKKKSIIFSTENFNFTAEIFLFIS